MDSLANGYVTAYGPGLIYGVCGEPGNFSISTKDVGPGGLSLSIEGPGKATISCHDNKDGTISVSYLPTDPGEYKIGVIFGGKHIRGSPFSAKITGTRGSHLFYSHLQNFLPTIYSFLSNCNEKYKIRVLELKIKRLRTVKVKRGILERN